MNDAAANKPPKLTDEFVDMDPNDHDILKVVRQRLNGLSSSIDTFLVKGFLAPETPAPDGSGMPSW
jgi:hypothetical protein